MKHNSYLKTNLIALILGLLALSPNMIGAKNLHKKNDLQDCNQSDQYYPPGYKDWLDLHLCTQVFDAISNADNRELLGFSIIPPDPIIAVGPEQVIALVNRTIGIFQKNNDECNSMEKIYLEAGENFFKFSSSGGGGDPWIVYNQFLDRFFIIAFNRIDNEGTEIYIAASKDSQPTNNTDFYHYRYIINGELADYPKIAVDNEVLYLSTNVFNLSFPLFEGQRIDAFDAQALANGPDDDNLSSLFTEKINTTGSSTVQLLFPLQPRPSKCSGAIEQVLFVEARRTDFNSSFFTGDTLRIHAYTDPLNSDDRVFFDLTVPPFTGSSSALAEQPPPLNNFFNQPLIGIETFLGVFNTGVTSKNSIWTCHNVFANGVSPQILTRWYEINVELSDTNLTANLKQSGSANDGSGSSQIWPSINVDKNDNMALQFALVGPDQYPILAYTARHACDPVGSVRIPFQRAVGGDLYSQVTFNGSRNRYGDYSGLAIDPSDGKTFWLFNEYPIPVPPSSGFPFGSDWTTFIGSFQINQSGQSYNAPQTKQFSTIKKRILSDPLVINRFTEADSNVLTSLPEVDESTEPVE